MKTLHLSIIAISVILTYTSAYAYNSTSTDYGNLSYLNQNQSTPKIISNGPIPTPLDIQKRMFDWCQAPRNDMGEIDPRYPNLSLKIIPKCLTMYMMPTRKTM